MNRLRSPIRWFGGKGNMVGKLLPLVPAHHTYVEVFGGGASLLLAHPPSPVEVYNDINHALYEFFMTLADEEAFARFYRRVAVLPHSRQLYNECRATWREQDSRDERVWRWFVVARQSFSGRFSASWGYDVTATARGMSAMCGKWLSCLERLPEIHARLQRVQIECNDWRVILDAYDTPETFFYLDPPYVHATRRNERYEFEMTDDDHRNLVERVQMLRGKVMLSGYPNDIYAPLDRGGWRRIEWRTACHAAARTRGTGILGEGAALRMQPRTESVWLNYEARDVGLLVNVSEEA